VRPFHLNSSVGEVATTWLGARFRRRVVAGFQQRLGAGRNDEVLSRMFEAMADEMPLRGVAMFSRGAISGKQLEVLLALLNGQLLRACRLYLSSRASRG